MKVFEKEEFYEIRDGEGKVLRKCRTLLEARLASLDCPNGSVIVERRFVDGEWEEQEMYVRLKTKHEGLVEEITPVRRNNGGL